MAILILQSCDTGPRTQTDERTTVRDSAGIEIVEYAENIVDLPIIFSIDDSVLVDLGGERKSPDQEIGDFAEVQRMPQGRFVVSDRGLLKVFDANGRFTHSIGHVGDGPGEYRDINGFCILAGDTLFVYRGERASFFTAAGDHVRSLQLLPDDSDINGCFDDGAFLVGYSNPGDSTRLPFRSDSATRHDGHNSKLNSIGILQTGSFIPRELPANGSRRISGKNLYNGDGRDPEFRVFHNERGLIRIIRWNDPGTPVDRDYMLKVILGDDRLTAQNNALVDRAMARTRPATVPRYWTLLADAAGRIWVQDYLDHPPVRFEHMDWTVFDSTGRPLGRMLDPTDREGKNVNVSRFEKDAVWLRWADSLGFTHLTLHRLRALPR